MAALRKEVQRLREEVAALKAAPAQVVHNHYHFGDGGMGQPWKNPYQPQGPLWPNHWPTVICQSPAAHEVRTTGSGTPGVIVLTQGDSQ